MRCIVCNTETEDEQIDLCSFCHQDWAETQLHLEGITFEDFLIINGIENKKLTKTQNHGTSTTNLNQSPTHYI